jgi:hypothetical protein
MILTSRDGSRADPDRRRRPDLLRVAAQNIRRKVVNEGWDWVTVITGGEGVGKSTLAIKWALLYDPEFNPAEGVVFDIDELLGLFARSGKGDIVVGDEGVNGFFNRDAMTKENKAAATTGMVARGMGIHLTLLIPNLNHLDPYWREHRVKTWIHVKGRGKAIYRVARRHEFSRGTYWQPQFRHYYGPVADNIWSPYMERKNRYMMAKVLKELERAEEARKPKGKPGRPRKKKKDEE